MRTAPGFQRPVSSAKVVSLVLWESGRFLLSPFVVKIPRTASLQCRPPQTRRLKTKKRHVFQPGPRPRGPRALFLAVSVQRRCHPGEMRDNLPAKPLCTLRVDSPHTKDELAAANKSPNFPNRLERLCLNGGAMENVKWDKQQKFLKKRNNNPAAGSQEKK